RVSEVAGLMGKLPGHLPQALEIPGGVAVGSEEVAAHVVVAAVPLPAAMIEEGRRLGADEPAAAGDEDPLHAEGSSPPAGPSWRLSNPCRSSSPCARPKWSLAPAPRHHSSSSCRPCSQPIPAAQPTAPRAP